MKSESRSQKRAKIIANIYYYELMGQPLDSVIAFESGIFSSDEIEIIEKIAEKYAKFQQLITQFLDKKWTFNRLDALERAILIFGCFELILNKKAETISEIVSYTKAFAPGDSYKFINKILDKIGVYYEELKVSQKTTK